MIRCHHDMHLWLCYQRRIRIAPNKRLQHAAIIEVCSFGRDQRTTRKDLGMRFCVSLAGTVTASPFSPPGREQIGIRRIPVATMGATFRDFNGRVREFFSYLTAFKNGLGCFQSFSPLFACRTTRCFSRFQSRSFSVSRLSCFCLPLASAISTLTK